VALLPTTRGWRGAKAKTLAQAEQGQGNAPLTPARPFFAESSQDNDQSEEIEPRIDDQQRDVMSGAPVADDTPSLDPVSPEPPAALAPEQQQPPANGDQPVDPSDFGADELAGNDDSSPLTGDADTNENDQSTGSSESDDLGNRFDCVVRLADLPGVSGSRLRQLTSDFARVGAKPVIVAGVNAQSNDIEPLVANHEYSSLVLALLLVNRSGPVNPMEYSEFANRTQAIADELDVLADVPDMNTVLTRARELDEELATLDAQVAVNVETEEALNPGNLLLVSKRLDLTEQGNNRFVRTGEDRQPIFSVSLGDKPNRLVLLLDVPRVPATSQPIREMVECAWHCCQAFEGKMVDDSGRPIDNDLFERIERQLGTHYQALEAAGVSAGSEQARRVFN